MRAAHDRFVPTFQELLDGVVSAMKSEQTREEKTLQSLRRAYWHVHTLRDYVVIARYISASVAVGMVLVVIFRNVLFDEFFRSISRGWNVFLSLSWFLSLVVYFVTTSRQETIEVDARQIASCLGHPEPFTQKRRSAGSSETWSPGGNAD
jgi:hypothetical protein